MPSFTAYGQLSTQTLDTENLGIVTASGIVAGGVIGVQFSGPRATLLNDGRIHGGSYGVAIFDIVSTIENTGSITGVLRGITVNSGNYGTSILNSGSIVGSGSQAEGIYSAAPIHVVNSGLITGRYDEAIEIITTDTSWIQNTGTILRTGNAGAAIVMGSGDDRLVNAGLIDGDVTLAEGDDIVRNSGEITGDLSLGSGNDVFDGRGGTVLGEVQGGNGSDRYDIDSAGMTLVESIIGGSDTVRSWVDHELSAYFETLLLQGNAIAGSGNSQSNTLTGNGRGNLLDGNAGNDTIEGRNGADTIEGGDGDDSLFGEVGWDVLFGGAGADTLSGGTGDDILQGGDGSDRIVGVGGADRVIGGQGADVLFGGSGGDSFLYLAVTDSGTTNGSRDRIEDFTSGVDEIDLSAIDANVNNAPDTGFTFVGSLTGNAGQLDLRVVGPDGFLEGDVDGDGLADFSILLTGVTALLATDLIL